MAKLNKEQYDYRRESAARRMSDNARIESLTPEQHELLSEVAKMRHDIHCDQYALYNSGNGSYGEYHRWLNCPDNNINYRLYLAKLPKIKWTVDLDSIPSDDDRYEGIIDNTDEAEDENLDEFYAMMNKINNDIERYLRKIDKKHGTEYAPSGALRV